MWRWVWLVAGVVVAARPVAAEQRDVEARAFREFERGRRLFEAEDYLAAAQHFEAAFRILPSASVHFNIARSYALAQEPGLAAEHYRAFLEARAGSPSRRRQVQEWLDALGEEVGWVRVLTTPQGGEVRVSGRVRGEAPVTLALRRGAHRVVATLGDARGEATLEVEAGEEYELTLDLPEEGAPDEPEEPSEPPPTRPFGTEPDPDPTPDPDPGDGGSSGGGGIGALHHGWFWAALGLTLGSGAALAAVGTNMLSLSEEYNGLRNREDPTLDEELRRDELLAAGPGWEMATTGLWVSTGLLAAATVLVAILTDWSTLGGGGTASAAPTVGWMPRLDGASAASP